PAATLIPPDTVSIPTGEGRELLIKILHDFVAVNKIHTPDHVTGMIDTPRHVVVQDRRMYNSTWSPGCVQQPPYRGHVPDFFGPPDVLRFILFEPRRQKLPNRTTWFDIAFD